jgi:hypothetical protein
MGFDKSGLEEFCEHMWLGDTAVIVRGVDGVEIRMVSDGDTAVLEDELGNRIRLDPQAWGHLQAAPEALMRRTKGKVVVGMWETLWGVEG